MGGGSLSRRLLVTARTVIGGVEMSDVPTPTPPAPISGFRSRAINAAVDYTTATRPLAGNGIRVTDGAGGKTISIDNRDPAPRAYPWQVRAWPDVDTTGSTPMVQWKVRVYGGLAVLYGVKLSAPTADGTDGVTGLNWFEAPETVEGASWLCVQSDGDGGWQLSWQAAAIDLTAGAEYRAIAYLVGSGPPPRLMQIECGVVDIGGGGGGGGGSGLSTTETVVTNVAWDDYNHKFTKTTEQWTFTNGLLTAVAAASTSDIVTAVQEMP